MDYAGKSICLTKMEFNILASAVNMDKFVCFQFPGEGSAQDGGQEEYNKSLFSLHKRGYLIAEEDSFSMDETIEDMFRVMKECKKVLVVDSVLDFAGQACFYFWGEHMVTVWPGTRKDEYIKLFYAKEEEFGKILEESGVLLEETLPDNLRELQEDVQLYEISWEQLKKAAGREELLQLAGVKTVFSIFVEGKEELQVGILAQPLQDKLFVKTKAEVEIQIYSVSLLIETLKQYRK